MVVFFDVMPWLILVLVVGFLIVAGLSMGISGLCDIVENNPEVTLIVYLTVIFLLTFGVLTALALSEEERNSQNHKMGNLLLDTFTMSLPITFGLTASLYFILYMVVEFVLQSEWEVTYIILFVFPLVMILALLFYSLIALVIGVAVSVLPAIFLNDKFGIAGNLISCILPAIALFYIASQALSRNFDFFTLVKL